MKKIYKEDVIFFMCSFIITCIIFIPFLQGHYATDTYNIANVGYYDYAINWSLKDGRIFMAIIGLIAYKIEISIEIYVFITLLIGLFISNIAVIILNMIVKKYSEPRNLTQKIFLFLICYITIFNFMYIENLYFVENIVMSISILLFIISSNLIIEKKNNYILKSTILTIIGVLNYQGTIGVMLVFSTLFTILKNKNDVKKILNDIVIAGLIAFVGLLFNVVVVKIIGSIFKLQQTRLGHIEDILPNIGTIILTLPDVLQDTCQMFPKNCFIFFVVILMAIMVVYDKKIRIVYTVKVL